MALNGSKVLKMPRNDSKWLLNDRISEITNLTTWDQKNSTNLSGQKKSRIPSRQKKSRNLSGQKQITQPLGTKKNQATSRDTKKIMKPLGMNKNNATSQTKKITQPLSQKKKKYNKDQDQPRPTTIKTNQDQQIQRPTKTNQD